MEEIGVLFSKSAMSALGSGNGLRKIVSRVQANTGLLYYSEIADVPYKEMLRSGVLLPVKRVIEYDGKVTDVSDLYLLNPGYVWKGEGWMRGVFEYKDGILT